MRVVLQRFRFRRTTLFIAGSCAVLAGIGLARLHIIFTGVAVLVLAGICGLFFRRKNAVSLVVVVALGLVLGLWRGAVMMNQIKPYQALSHKKVMLQAVATEDATYTTNTQIMFVASNVKVVSPYTQTLPGKIKVAGFGQNMIYRGDLVQVEGSLWPTRGGEFRASDLRYNYT